MNQERFVKDVITVTLALVIGVAGHQYFIGKSAVYERPVSRGAAGGWNYRNEKYGFELSLPREYEGYNVSEDALEGGSSTKILRFNIDSSGTTWPYNRFSVFHIIVYTIDWWDKNAEPDENGLFYIKGEEQYIGNYLGLFLGENNKYAFTWGRGHDCPGLPEQENVETIQCKLFETAHEVVKTFKIIE